MLPSCVYILATPNPLISVPIADKPALLSWILFGPFATKILPIPVADISVATAVIPPLLVKVPVVLFTIILPVPSVVMLPVPTVEIFPF